jgi:hypothetical protein
MLHVNGDLSHGLSENNFGTMDTPFGVCSLHVMYRNACMFKVQDSEMALNDRFLDFDDAYFIPRPIEFSPQKYIPFQNDGRPITRRKTSQTSISTDFSEKSEHPPHSLTSPYNISPVYGTSFESQSKSIKPISMRLISQGSLPSPSNFLSFTPPSVPNSFRTDPLKSFLREPPPFSVAMSEQSPLPLNPLNANDLSPPFAIHGTQSQVSFIFYYIIISLNQNVLPSI